jgi:ketosteroid isomerase-like protein
MPARHPEELHKQFVERVNAHDLDGLMDLYVDEPEALDMEGKPLHGATELRAFLGGFLSAVKHHSAETRKMLVADDIALMSSAWKAVVHTPDGDEVVSEGVSMEVARRGDDGIWRLVLDDPMVMS